MTPEDYEALRVNFAIADAGIPPLFIGAKWESFEFDPTKLGVSDAEKKLVARLDEFRAWRGDGDSGSIVFICGPPGTGKTHLAVSTIWRWIAAAKKGAMFLVVGELLAMLRRGFNDGTADSTLKRAQRAGLLVLDDLGSEMTTDWVRDTIYTVINHRINHIRPTVVTSNLTPNEIAQSYHERLASRLAGGLVINTSPLRDRRIGGA